MRLLLLLCGVSAAWAVPVVPVLRDLESTFGDMQESFLETQLTTQGMAACTSNGDTHVNTWDQGYTDVMGTEEWVAASGPDNGRKWEVQGYQDVWQGCGDSNPQITILQDIAFRCGSFYAMYDAPEPVSSCIGRHGFSSNTLSNPHLYVKGTASDGTVYDGRDYWKQMNPGKEVRFEGGRIYMRSRGCADQNCKISETIWPLIQMDFDCDGTSTQVNSYQHSGWSGGSFTELRVSVENTGSSTSPRCGSSRNLLGGYCGCWQNGNTYNTLRDAWVRCQQRNRQSPGYKSFYDPANQSNCVHMFVTTRETSIFNAFASWTASIPNYAHKYTSAKHTAMSRKELDNVHGFDQVLWDKHFETCVSRFVQLVGFNPDFSKKNEDFRTLNAYNVAKSCADDQYYGLEWEDKLLVSEFCENANLAVQEERKDIYCAYKLLEPQCLALSPKDTYGRLLMEAKNPQDVDAIKDKNTELYRMSNEVATSLNNIDYWFMPRCADTLARTTNLDQLDCSTHVFKETGSLKCPDWPPGKYVEWDGSCEKGQKNGGKCTAVCDNDAVVFPANAPAQVQYECKLHTEPTLGIEWSAPTQLVCCAGTCDSPTQIFSGNCVQSVRTCADCAKGMKSNGDSTQCQNVPCPDHSSGHPNCKCNPGYRGSLQWNAATGKWDGQCQKIECPPNAVDHPGCVCLPQFAGTISWNTNDQAYQGSCISCTHGTNFASQNGQATCTPCRQCTDMEVEISDCTPGANRVCACKPGTRIQGDGCVACTQEDDRIVRYTDQPGQTVCKDCMICNSNFEEVAKACTPTSNTKCRCTEAGVTAGSCRDEAHELV